MDADAKLTEIARDVSDMRVAIARIEVALGNLSDDLDELEGVHARIDSLESAVGQAKAWSAGGAANQAIDWFGTCYGTGVPTAQNIADWWTLSKSARAIQDMPGASPATRLWRPGAPLGNVTDLVGGKVLQMGSPQDQVLRVVGTF